MAAAPARTAPATMEGIRNFMNIVFIVVAAEHFPRRAGGQKYSKKSFAGLLLLKRAGEGSTRLILRRHRRNPRLWTRHWRRAGERDRPGRTRRRLADGIQPPYCLPLRKSAPQNGGPRGSTTGRSRPRLPPPRFPPCPPSRTTH